MDRMTEMEAFTSVVEQGGFTGAARKMGLSKSAISKHVSSLEARLGVRLLDRTTRRVAPTDMGLVYYDKTRSVLSAVVDAEQMVAEKSLAPEGLLRVALADETAMRFVGAGLPDFLKAYPRLTVHLVQVDGYVEMMSDGYDMTVATGIADIAMRSQLLTEVDFVLVASPVYLAQFGELSRIEDLAAHHILHSSGEDGNAKFHLVSRSGERRAIHSAGRLVVRDTAMILHAVESGAGIGFLPSFVVEEALSAGRVVTLLNDLPPQSAPVYASHPPGEQINPKVRAFLSHYKNDKPQVAMQDVAMAR